MLSIKENHESLTFKIFVQPRSSKNKIVGLHGDALKVKLTAPPVDGSANKMCLKYLAKCLEVPKSSVSIVAGQTSRTKQIRIAFTYCEDVQKEIDRLNQILLAW